MRRVVCAAALALAAAACGDDGEGGGVGSTSFQDEGPESPPVASPAVSLSPNRTRARAAQDHLLNYGTWDDAEAIARTYDVVVVDPADALTRSIVQSIQAGTGPGDRVLVLCYLSIGEDIRTVDKTDAQMLADARFTGDRTGPRMDPRGPYADGESLTGIDPIGLPSNGGTGYASYYLDDVSVRNGAGNVGDGKPDRNGNFGGAFVNAGDPKWFDALQDMRLDGVDRVAGLRELLTTTYGRGLGCDGLFLDTIDTAAPNQWTSASSSNETKYEWTAPGFALFLARLRAAYPDVVLLQNRGLFFFNPRNVQYDFIPRGLLDFVLFESYRLNSGSSNNPDPVYYPDNRFNFAPKLMAEANRPDGFRVLSLGYAEGPSSQMSEATLVGGSTLGTTSLLEDIRVAERLAGFRHYLTNSSITLVNQFVETHADRSDTAPPVWTSTYNDHNGVPAGESTPRTGVRQVVPGAGSLTVRWDVALDLDRVSYTLYLRTTPFDFAADPTLSTATRIVLDPKVPTAYADGAGPTTYAHEATIPNLAAGQLYYAVIRAVDETGHEDTNQVVLTGTPDAGAQYLGNLSAVNGMSSLTYRAQYTQDWTYRRVYVDRDRMPGTGWRSYGIGVDFLIENGNLYRYTGTGTSWAWTFVKKLTMTTGPAGAMSFVQWDFLIADLGDTRDTNLVFQVQRTGAVITSAIYRHTYTTSDPSAPISGYSVRNDPTRVSLHADVNQAFTYKHVFLDTDANAATGYTFGGIGADYMIENGSLYRHTGGGWSFTKVGSANMVVTGVGHDWSILRSEVGAATGSPTFRVVFQANGGSPTYVTPVYVHPFSS